MNITHLASKIASNQQTQDPDSEEIPLNPLQPMKIPNSRCRSSISMLKSPILMLGSLSLMKELKISKSRRRRRTRASKMAALRRFKIRMKNNEGGHGYLQQKFGVDPYWASLISPLTTNQPDQKTENIESAISLNSLSQILNVTTLKNGKQHSASNGTNPSTWFGLNQKL